MIYESRKSVYAAVLGWEMENTGELGIEVPRYYQYFGKTKILSPISPPVVALEVDGWRFETSPGSLSFRRPCIENAALLYDDPRNYSINFQGDLIEKGIETKAPVRYSIIKKQQDAEMFLNFYGLGTERGKHRISYKPENRIIVYEEIPEECGLIFEEYVENVRPGSNFRAFMEKNYKKLPEKWKKSIDNAGKAEKAKNN